MASLKIDESEIKKPDIGYIPTHYRDVMREEGGSATNLPTLKGTETIPNQGSQTQKSNFDLLREQNYAAFANSQIQLESAKQNAMKSTNTQLASQGLLGTGYGGLYGNGIQSSYMNALAQAQANYQNTNNEIAQQELAQQQTDISNAYQNALAQFDLASDQTSLEKIITSYGVGVNEDGTLNYDNAKYQFTDEQKAGLQNYYDAYMRDYQEADNQKLQARLTALAGDKSEVSYNGKTYKKDELGEWYDATPPANDTASSDSTDSKHVFKSTSNRLSDAEAQRVVNRLLTYGFEECEEPDIPEEKWPDYGYKEGAVYREGSTQYVWVGNKWYKRKL